ncbi:GAF domain-containing protein [Mucilaginibacter agri]|uniref:GAF domain-containing protein n=1 Tax=Mucilaginibacter agri TaxID=2695265 RepID=A0A966DR76_9SPHI|nr:GAF domain-containing protein [Mucilaginibacter agri]NCD68753.1 GAF domain-containing protein [Mucilaginibacter agri]
MQVNVFNIDKKLKAESLIDAVFSFHVFAEDLKRRINTEKTIKGEFYKMVLSKIEEYPELSNPIPVEDAAKYQHVLEMVYAVLSPAIADETEYLWGIGMPVPGDMIYGTDAFQQFIAGYNSDPKTILNQGSTAFLKRVQEYLYRLILKKVYKFSPDINSDSIYTQENNESGLERYFKIHVDTTYAEIKAKQELPELNAGLIEEFLQVGTGGEVLEDILPLSMFRVEGFAVITVEDITAQQSIENIRLALVNNFTDQNELFESVTHSLQTLIGNNAIEFGLLPFLKVNGKLVYDTEECFTSVLINAYSKEKVSEELYNQLTADYIKDPKAVFYNEIDKDKSKESVYLAALHKVGIVSYAVLPVYFNRKVAGVMEIYSKKSVIHFEELLSKLEIAVPLLSQLLHNSIEKFNERIEEVIKDKFTTLQHAVEWKFNEVAWNYIREQRDDEDTVEIKTVGFKDVDPLYGAVDIRNSTNERNLALQNDLKATLQKLSDTINAIQKHKAAAFKPEILVQCDTWLRQVSEEITDTDEASIKAFLESEVYSVFDVLKAEVPETTALIEEYFETTDELSGDGFAARRELEISIGMINTALNNYFEKAHPKLQKIYPCYFEKFRTDGVEYDIYTGQSLAPDKPFDDNKLGAFRQWQLKSMIDIVQITGKLTTRMKCKLQTTQLIFVHSGPIDICFRKDERRFDVEGVYNIRYEVIKKRIDKVLIKDTDERLTQPGKIALVYFTQAEADEFMNYIKEFQDKKLLAADIEQLDLEELQGVTGLKAIRVTVEEKVN